MNNVPIYDINGARLLVKVQHELRYNGYPNEQANIQDTIQEECPDVGEILFSGNHSDNVIVLNPKGKSIDVSRVTGVMNNIVKAIYNKYIVNKYGNNNEMSTILPSMLFYVINTDEQVKIYI